MESIIKILASPFEFTVAVLTRSGKHKYRFLVMFVILWLMLVPIFWLILPSLSKWIFWSTPVVITALIIGHVKLSDYKMFSSQKNFFWKGVVCIPAIVVLALSFAIMTSVPLWLVPLIYALSGIASIMIDH